MENIDLLVLRAMAGWLASGRRALLATVVRTWGSSPRPVGSMMALCEDGAVVGSVSGGCVEDDLLLQFAQAMPSGPPRFLQYGVNADEAHRFGLPCGGTLELLLEFNPEVSALQTLLAQLDRGLLVRRSLRLADGTVTLQSSEEPAELALTDEALHATLGPGYRMLIIGAGQLSEYVATMAVFNGFAVSVCDPRTEYRSHWAVPGATLLEGMPDDVVQAFRPDRRSCVIALTHDPKLDDLALLEALRSDAFYIGAIGSRRNHAARRQRMVEHLGQTPQSLACLRGPIGIFIGSKTPSEIAVSVMAEILAVKNGVTLPRHMEVAHAKNTRAVAPAAQDDAGRACGTHPH